MSWLQLTVIAGRDGVDRVAACLEAHGAAAVSLAGVGEDELLEPHPGEVPLWQRVRIQALMAPAVNLRGLQAALLDCGARLDDAEFLADADWQSRWRDHAVRECFGDRLWIVPRDDPVGAPAGTGSVAVLRLDPGLAFGSGAHPTTRLCLTALAGAPLAGRRVLDFGCGSGVLAAAACLLGAREAVAVDHDPQALLAARDNGTYNQISSERLRVMTPEALEAAAAAPFDVVVANILANSLAALAPVLTGHTAVDGRLVLSGLLDGQESMMREAYPDIEFGEPTRESGWICLQGRRARAGG